jgi:hypothetical protein
MRIRTLLTAVAVGVLALTAEAQLAVGINAVNNATIQPAGPQDGY